MQAKIWQATWGAPNEVVRLSNILDKTFMTDDWTYDYWFKSEYRGNVML